MKRILLALVFACVGVTALGAVTYAGSETITVTGTPTAFTAAKIAQGNGHAQALYALCRNEGAEIRFTVDPAVTVTATTNGALIEDGEWIPGLSGTDVLTNFRAIITTLTTSKLQCFYFG